ncbi:MAG: AMP-binding protein [Bdellovibrionaceae bacterium]|nr:AMP-binding protein [Bdellovibrionales bacterium]MCB9083814.1 AMP-binding protein [Pseudobdellovibrionaceae bacterium]
MEVLKSSRSLGEVKYTIGQMLLANGEKFAQRPAFAEKENGKYRYWQWQEVKKDLTAFAGFLLQQGFKAGDRIGFVAGNNYARLIAEMATMSIGCVSVPIFIGYAKDFLNQLVEFSDLQGLVVENGAKFKQVQNALWPKEVVILSGPVEEKWNSGKTTVRSFGQVLEQIQQVDSAAVEAAISQVKLDQQCMIMFTSGTTNFPKGVMLSHRNIMSQQTALESLWQPEEGMRFLCYLPWHHSFGGLFERFFALHSGGCLAVDDSAGKDIDLLFENFKTIKPHVYFSVPKIYQEIIGRVLTSKEAEATFFHPDLKFVFTAAAPLPLSVSNVFTKKGIPVAEGWGLTETSPCCTLTELSLQRELGVVGFPIPGVEVKLDPEGEILVRGPNVMSGYFRNPEATERVLEKDGWFHTGDVGEITPGGVKILSRKDRVFKLSNGEKVFPAGIEERLRTRCKFIKHAYVFGSGQQAPLALLFPNMDLVNAESVGDVDAEACKNPCSSQALSGCLRTCIDQVNESNPIRFEKVKRALVVQQELSLDKNELTPSFKLVPRTVEKNFAPYILSLQKQDKEVPEGSYLVSVDEEGEKGSE